MVDKIMAASCLQLCARRSRTGCASVVRIERSPRPIELCHGILIAPLLWAAILCVGCVPASVCAACIEQSGQSPPVQAQNLPSLESALDALLAARGWLDAPNLPDFDDESAFPVPPGTSMMVVILRNVEGRLVGIGEDAQPDSHMLRRAVGRAFSKALGHSSIARIRELLGDDLGDALTIELELCGTSAPLLGRTIFDCAMRITPGVDGIALRRGEAHFRLSPARLLATDSAEKPEGAMRMLISDAGLPDEDLPQLSTHDSIAFSSFPSTRVLETTPDRVPLECTRAGRLISTNNCTRSELGAFLEVLVARLASDVVELDEGLRTVVSGDYDAIAAKHEPPIARAREQALVALALATASANGQLPNPLRDRVRNAAVNALRGVLSAPEEASVTTDALSLLTLCALDELEKTLLVDARTKIVSRLIDASTDPKHADSLPIVAAALMHAHCPQGAEVLSRAWALHEGALASNLAWLALAQSAHPVPAYETELRKLGTLFSATQILDQAMDAPEDLRGGFNLGSLQSAPFAGRRAAVDSQSSRIAHALALLLGNAQVVPESELIERTRTQMWAMRFLRQLMLDEPLTGCMRDGADAKGRIRAGLGTYRAPVAAQAMAVLAVTESLRAIDARSAVRAIKAAETAPTDEN